MWSASDILLYLVLFYVLMEVVSMTPEVQKLKDAYEANKVEVQAALTGLMGKIADLTAKLAVVPGIDPDITALTDEISADTIALHATQAPVVS